MIRIHLAVVLVSIQILHVAIISRFLLYLKIDALIAARLLLVLHVPHLVVLAALGSRHLLPQVVPAVFLPAIRVGEVHGSVSVRARGNGQVRSVGARGHHRRLVDLLGCVYVLGQLASKLLLARGVRLLAAHRLLLLVQLVAEGFVARAHRLFDDHAAGVVGTSLLLPQRG